MDRNKIEDVEASRIHCFIGPLLIQKLTSRAQSHMVKALGELVAWEALDWWVSINLRRTCPSVVVGYEMCCARTFGVAKQLGIRCVLDAAAFEYSFQDRILVDDAAESQTWPGKLLRERKKREVESADLIICVSEFARKTYLSAGCDKNKIVVNPVGCDIELFRPSVANRAGPIKFAFVGIPCYRKGFELLIKAFQSLREMDKKVELHVIGDPVLASRYISERDEGIKLYGKLPHLEIGKILSGLDVIVLPSRLDSFGMVVIEGLACGIAAIVSDRVGASQAIRGGENGWVVESGNGKQLLDVMRHCSENIEATRLMTQNCRASAVVYDWSAYADRAREILLPLLQSPRGCVSRDGPSA